MLYKQYRKCIYFLLILTVFISGMCFEKIQADSFLKCEQSEVNDWVPALSARETSSQTICTEEMLVGSNVLSPVSLTRRIGVRTLFRTILSLAFIEYLVRRSLLFSKAIIEKISFIVHSYSVIIHYIHQQDGAKA